MVDGGRKSGELPSKDFMKTRYTTVHWCLPESVHQRTCHVATRFASLTIRDLPLGTVSLHELACPPEGWRGLFLHQGCKRCKWRFQMTFRMFIQGDEMTYIQVPQLISWDRRSERLDHKEMECEIVKCNSTTSGFVGSCCLFLHLRVLPIAVIGKSPPTQHTLMCVECSNQLQHPTDNTNAGFCTPAQKTWEQKLPTQRFFFQVLRLLDYPSSQNSWKWQWVPPNTSFLAFRVIFHFCDFWRKGNFYYFEAPPWGLMSLSRSIRSLGPALFVLFLAEEFLWEIPSAAHLRQAPPKVPGCVVEARWAVFSSTPVGCFM